MVESFLAGKKAWVPGIQGATGPVGWYAGSTGISGVAGYTGGFDMAAGYTSYAGGFDMAAGYTSYAGYTVLDVTGVLGVTGARGFTGIQGGYTAYAGFTGAHGTTGIRGWSISRLALIDQGSSNFFNASWVSDPADPTAYIPTSYTVGTSSVIVDRVDVRGTGPEAFLVGAKKRVGKPLLQRLIDFLRRWL
jgi:hypothetical protein